MRGEAGEPQLLARVALATARVRSGSEPNSKMQTDRLPAARASTKEATERRFGREEGGARWGPPLSLQPPTFHRRKRENSALNLPACVTHKNHPFNMSPFVTPDGRGSPSVPQPQETILREVGAGVPNMAALWEP